MEIFAGLDWAKVAKESRMIVVLVRSIFVGSNTKKASLMMKFSDCMEKVVRKKCLNTAT